MRGEHNWSDVAFLSGVLIGAAMAALVIFSFTPLHR